MSSSTKSLSSSQLSPSIASAAQDAVAGKQGKMTEEIKTIEIIQIQNNFSLLVNTVSLRVFLLPLFFVTSNLPDSLYLCFCCVL